MEAMDEDVATVEVSPVEKEASPARTSNMPYNVSAQAWVGGRWYPVRELVSEGTRIRLHLTGPPTSYVRVFTLQGRTWKPLVAIQQIPKTGKLALPAAYARSPQFAIRLFFGDASVSKITAGHLAKPSGLANFRFVERSLHIGVQSAGPDSIPPAGEAAESP